MNITKKQLKKLYIEQKKSLRIIAKELYTNQTNIFKLIHKYKIVTRKVGTGINWQLSPYYQHLKKEMQLKRIATMKKNGFIPWNKGLTTDTDVRVKKNEKNRRKVRTYKTGPQGWHHTDEFKRRQSLNHGGTGVPYENNEYGADFDTSLKEQVRFRDKYKCRICGCSQLENGRQLDVHHIDYDKTYNKIDNLISLCHGCHTKTNVNREHWILYFCTLVHK
jgi:hypothetical protein